MKVDLVIWTLNSDRTLALCLSSIDRAIPQKFINQKIMVDGHSKDETQEIGERFDWQVYDAEKVGIPDQANQALGLVKTEFFASFEHDIILNPCWFNYVFPHILDKQVAVAHGVRVSTHPVMKKIETWILTQETRYTCLDNTFYRTDVIRKIGGFNLDYRISADRELQDRVQAHGYKWIVERKAVSDHIRHGIRSSEQHIKDYFMLSNYPEKFPILPQIARVAFSSIRGLQIAVDMNCPQAIYVYPYMRLTRLEMAIKKRR